MQSNKLTWKSNELFSNCSLNLIEVGPAGDTWKRVCRFDRWKFSKSSFFG